MGSVLRSRSARSAGSFWSGCPCVSDQSQSCASQNSEDRRYACAGDPRCVLADDRSVWPAGADTVMARYKHGTRGEWTECAFPPYRNKFACCGCGLTYEHEYKMIPQREAEKASRSGRVSGLTNVPLLGYESTRKSFTSLCTSTSQFFRKKERTHHGRSYRTMFPGLETN